MAQMFSSGVTPDYLKALSDAYAQYFPQQTPVNTQALQQWYSPNGSSAFAAPQVLSAAPSSVVGSLFGEQYPQVRQGGGDSRGMQGNIGEGATGSLGAGNFSGDFGGLLGSLGSGLQSIAASGLLGPQAKIAALIATAVQKAQASGSQVGGMSVGGYAPGSQEGAAAAAGTVGGYGPGTPRFNTGGGGGAGGGAATGGKGGDASGGGDRGTRGGF